MRSPILLFRAVWRLSKFAAGHVQRSDTTLLCLRKMRDLRSTIPQVIALSRIHFIPRHWANSNFAAENGKLRAGILAPRLRSRAILWSGDF